MQAWGRGTPVVSFLDPGELIAREGLGQTVANLTDMQQAIAALAADAELWEAASGRCRRYMDREHAPGEAAAPYLAALAAL